MRENHVRHLFNEPGDRERVCAGLGRAVAGHARIALAMACYLVWMVACCSGPGVSLGGGGASGAAGGGAAAGSAAGAAASGAGAAGALVVPAWLGPLACMALASVVIAVCFRRTRTVPSSRSWIVALATLMTLAAALHLVWALDAALPPLARGALYMLASIVMGAGCALFRVEIDRVFGWIGTQQTLYQGMVGTTASALALAALAVAGDVAGMGSAPLLATALVLPCASALLLRSVVRGFPKARYFDHGRDVPLPFPAKFVATSCVQGVAAGALFAGLFALGLDGTGAVATTAAQAVGAGAASTSAASAAAAGAGAALPVAGPDGALLRSLGQLAAVMLLFATIVFLRLDFNRLVYKVAFPFVAAGFVLLALVPGAPAVGNAVLAAGFCYLDLVLWSLGACLMKNMGLPATWIASCPGAALFCGVLVGGGAALALVGGAPSGTPIGALLAAPSASPDVALLACSLACLVLAAALFLSSGSNLKYGWGTVRPGESVFAAGDLAGVVRFVATERAITQRESEVMLLLAQGKSRRAVCEALSVSPDTVKTHVRSIYRKLAVHSQQELVDLLEREREDLAPDGSEPLLEG